MYYNVNLTMNPPFQKAVFFVGTTPVAAPLTGDVKIVRDYEVQTV